MSAVDEHHSKDMHGAHLDGAHLPAVVVTVFNNAVIPCCPDVNSCSA